MSGIEVNTENMMEEQRVDKDPKTEYLNLSDIYIATLVGSAVALFATLLTLLSYIGYRKFWVKRTHIMMFNLCMSLLVFFISYIVTNYHRHFLTETLSVVCVAGAFIGHLAILCAWFWISSYWVLILIMYRRPSRVYINHFFLKASFACYLVPIIIAAITVSVAGPKRLAERNQTLENHTFYSNNRCFIDGMYMYIGMLLPFVLILFMILVIFLMLLGGFAQKEDSPKKPGTAAPMGRIKKHMAKASAVSITIFIVALSTILIPHEDPNIAAKISGVCFSIGSIALTIVLLLLFFRHRKDIQKHWVAIIRGKSKMNHSQRSVSLSKANSFSKISPRSNVLIRTQKEDSDLQQLQDGDLAEMERKSSIRIIPKDDTDMSTLGLIQIPGIPATHQEQNESSDAVIRDPNIKKYEGNLEESEKKETNSVVTNPIIIQEPTEIAANQSLPEKVDKKAEKNSRPTSPNALTKSKSNDIAQQGGVEKKINQKNPKRRSFSSSSFRPLKMGKQLSIMKRQSVLSTDSTQMTNFE